MFDLLHKIREGVRSTLEPISHFNLVIFRKVPLFGAGAWPAEAEYTMLDGKETRRKDQRTWVR